MTQPAGSFVAVIARNHLVPLLYLPPPALSSAAWGPSGQAVVSSPTALHKTNQSSHLPGSSVSLKREHFPVLAAVNIPSAWQCCAGVLHLCWQSSPSAQLHWRGLRGTGLTFSLSRCSVCCLMPWVPWEIRLLCSTEQALGMSRGLWAAQSQIFAAGHGSLELQQSWKADCPLDLGLRRLIQAPAKLLRARPACFCVVDSSAFLHVQGAQGSQCPWSCQPGGVWGWGVVLGVPSLSEPVPISKSPNCSRDLPELLFWCQQLLLAQLHTCAKWLWSCPRGLSRVGIKSCIWLAGLSFLPGCNCFF